MKDDNSVDSVQFSPCYMHPNGSFKHSVYNNVASSLAGVSLRSTEGYEWLTGMSTWSPRNQYLPNGDSNNF